MLVVQFQLLQFQIVCCQVAKFRSKGVQCNDAEWCSVRKWRVSNGAVPSSSVSISKMLNSSVSSSAVSNSSVSSNIRLSGALRLRLSGALSSRAVSRNKECSRAVQCHGMQFQVVQYQVGLAWSINAVLTSPLLTCVVSGSIVLSIAM